MEILQPGLFLAPVDTEDATVFTTPAINEKVWLNIDVGGTFNLPADAFIGQRIAVLGSSGFGKSNTIAVLFEELADQLPITIFDPHGEYYGLTEKFDILHVGKGEFVDIEAGINQAESIAKFAFENRVHVIVNMLEMTDDERLEFTYIYCKTLWDLNRRIKRPIGIILDEAHIFVPESKANIPALTLMIQFALEGRKFGFTVVFSDQRVATISKSVLAQCGMAFLHGVDIYADMQAYQGMLPYSMAETKKLAYGLKRGQAIVKWTHEGDRGVDIIQIRKRHTFHASDTPTASRAGMPELRRLDSEMIAELKAAMKPPQKPVSAIIAPTDSPAATEAYKQTLLVIEEKYERQHRQERAGLFMLAMAHWVTVKRLKAQIAYPPAALPSVDETRETAEAAIIESELDEPFRSPRALTRAINKQERAFNQFIIDLKKLPRFHQLVLVYLTIYEGNVMDVKQVARFIGISENTLLRTPPTELLRRKLLKRDMHRGKYQRYSSNVREALTTLYPDLDSDTMVDEVIALQRLS